MARLNLLAEVVRPNSDRCAIAASATTIYRFNYASGNWSIIGTNFSPLGKRWQTVQINGWIIFNNGVDLPVSYRVEDTAVQPIHELREVGVASVGWITHYNGFLFAMNVVTVIAESLPAVMSGANPYGIVTPSLTNHIPYRVIWSEFGQPRNWSPIFKVTLNASTANITLPFISPTLIVGVRVAVINGGPDGTTLGGDEAHPEGILITAVAGSTITLEIPTDAALDYPREVQVLRWTDISAISSYKDLQGDATEILGGKALHSVLIIYRDKGIYVARYTGSPSAPFDWKERVPGTPNVPMWMDALVTVGDDEYHLYPGAGKFFFAFDGVNPPSVHAVMDETRKRFFAGLTDSSEVWAVNNPLTQESWFCRSGFTMCFDYARRTASEIDAEFSAAALITRPGEDYDWFIIAINHIIFVYGRVLGEPTTYKRNGVNPGGRLVWGRGAFGDTFNEKRVRSHQVQLSSRDGPLEMRVRLYSAHTASAPRIELVNEVLDDPAGEGGMIPLHFQDVYFQDELHIEGDGDVEVRFVGRLLERSGVRNSGSTRHNISNA